jgi:hypothetical protein
LILNAVVLVASGKLIGVKTSARSRKPWDPVASENIPTMSPVLLIPAAAVEVDPGTLIGVKVPLILTNPCSTLAASW